MGLTSFRDMQSLMPQYDRNNDFHVIKIPMSDYQFGVYDSGKVQERKLEMQSAKNKRKKTDEMYE